LKKLIKKGFEFVAINVELSKFKVKKGKTEVVEEWMNFLSQHMEQVLLTLKDEKMYVESIFREKDAENEYLYWFSVQDEGGNNVEESRHEVDKKHLEYWYECIDEEIPHVDLETKVVMIPDTIRNVME
jgi:hypothetical protein